MITWKETIEVILSTFSISQKDLSNYLSISESTLSRLKNGKIGTKLDYDIVFRDVFDPNTQGSPAHALNETESWLLSLLKETIEKRFKNVQKILVDKNCWEIENYKSFILEWLKLTRNDLTAEDYGNMEGLESSTEAPDEQMVRIFEQSISKYHIATYIYKLPNYLTDGFPLSAQHFDMVRFLYKGIIINHKKTEPTYIKRRFLTKDGVFTSDGRNALSGHPPMVDKAARQNLMPYFWTKCPEVVLCL